MKNVTLAAAIALSGLSQSAMAQEVEVSITNLTQGIYYTPFIVAAHSAEMSLFSVGEMASPELQAMAEGGDISGLSSILTSGNADVVENPAMGLLAPGMSTMAMFEDTAEGNMYLSLTAMLLPTNDGFVGLDSWKIPSEAGTYTFTVNAYDAGTEANDEIVNGGGAPGVAGIPAAPGGSGTGGAGVTDMEENTYVHIHRGSLGDDDLAGGKSDLDNTVHRWLNPVARVTVTVK